MKEMLRWLGHVLLMKDDRLPKIVLFGQPPGATRKSGRPCLGWEGVKREALNRLGWTRSVRSCVGLRRACYCSELLVVVVVVIFIHY